MDMPTVLACLPTDRELVEEMWALTGLPLDECPKPTDLYTLANCARCDRSIWIGPRQKLVVALQGLEAWCYFCAGGMTAVTHLGGGNQVEGVSRW